MLISECVTTVSRRPLLRFEASTGSSRVEASPDLLCTDVRLAESTRARRSVVHHHRPCPSLESRTNRPSRIQVWTLPAPYLFEVESPAIVYLVTRAVHLDIVCDLSAGTFLRCLKRFAARRGLPRKFLSDNGKTFHSGHR